MYTDTEKRCPQCKKWLPHSMFYKNKWKTSGMSAYCKPCHGKNLHYSPEQTRKRRLKCLYGITPEEYKEMYDAQEGKCAFPSCGKPIEDIDHDHQTKKVRALLCHSCNTALGLFYENPAVLREAADYIEFHKETS